MSIKKYLVICMCVCCYPVYASSWLGELWQHVLHERYSPVFEVGAGTKPSSEEVRCGQGIVRVARHTTMSLLNIVSLVVVFVTPMFVFGSTHFSDAVSVQTCACMCIYTDMWNPQIFRLMVTSLQVSIIGQIIL